MPSFVEEDDNAGWERGQVSRMLQRSCGVLRGSLLQLPSWAALQGPDSQWSCASFDGVRPMKSN